MTDNDQTNVSRRNLGTLLGVLGGAAGLSVLSGCTNTAAASEGSAQQALAGSGFLWVDSIVGGTGSPANLRAITGSDASGISQPVVVVGGYETPADGGGGVFYWSNVPGEDDGGTFIVPGSGSVNGEPALGPGWQRLFSGDFNVKWFGAKGDGVSADDAAIQRAIKAATGFDAAVPGSIASKHGTLYFPAGNYSVTQTLLYVGGSGSQFGMRGQIAGGFGVAQGFNYSATVISWAPTAPTPSYDAAGNPLSGVVLELRGMNRGFIEHLDIDGGLRAGVCVWFHSDQPHGGAGSDACVFRRCSFLNAAGGPNSVLFLVGDYQAQLQTDNSTWEDCLFQGNQANENQISVAACWRSANAGNTKNFAFYGCGFLGAMIGVDAAFASGCLLIDGGGFGPVGAPAWASGQVGACVRLGPNGTTTIRNCEVESTADAVAPSGARFVEGFFGGVSLTATTLTVESCSIYITLPPDNVIIGFAGKMTLIGNNFFGGFGSPSLNQSSPVISCGNVGFAAGNPAPVSVFSLNNLFPGLPFGSYAPYIESNGSLVLPLTGPGSWGGVNRMSVWSIGDTSVTADGTMGVALKPWIGLLPEIGPAQRITPQWSVNPVPNAAAATWTLVNWAGSTAGSLDVGDMIFVSSTQALPPGVSLSATATAPNQITATIMNLSGSPQTIAGDLNLSVWPRT